MEGPFRLLGVLLGALLPAVVLLGALLLAAAATFGPQPGAPCKPTLLATKVMMFCAPDMPTVQCCEAVVTAVDLGGGVPCLCRVAAEPQIVMAGINTTHLVALYISCGGVRNDTAHLTAACQERARPAAVPPSPRPPQHDAAARVQPSQECGAQLPSSSLPYGALHQHGGEGQVPVGNASAANHISRNLREATCDPYALAGALADSCGDTYTPSTPCCKFVLMVIDQDCACQVLEMPEVILAGMDIRQIWSLYDSCHGTRLVPDDRSVCTSQSPPPPPPPPPAPSPPAPSPPHTPPDSQIRQSLIEPAVQDLVERLLNLATGATVGAYVVAGVMLAACAGLLLTIWKMRRAHPIRGEEEGRRLEMASRDERNRSTEDERNRSREDERHRQPGTSPSAPVPSALAPSASVSLPLPVPVPSAPPVPTGMI